MPRLDVRHLLMLDALDASPSMSDAARKLNITASALSHRMREAERRVGVPLFMRTARKPQLTDAGVHLLNVAIAILRTLDQAEREVATSHGQRLEIVRIAASTLSGYEWLPNLLRTLQNEHPGIDLEVALDVALDPLAALRERTIDIAIVPSQVNMATLSSVPLFNDEMIVLMPAGHPKASRPWLDAHDLVDEVYVADGLAHETGREFERLFAPAGIQPRRVLRAGLMDTVVSLVRAGFGVTVATRASARPYLRGDELVAIALTQHGLSITWHAVLRSEDFHSSAARRVADSLAMPGREAYADEPSSGAQPLI